MRSPGGALLGHVAQRYAGSHETVGAAHGRGIHGRPGWCAIDRIITEPVVFLGLPSPWVIF